MTFSNSTRFTVLIMVCIAVTMIATTAAGDTQFLTINSRTHCCFNTAMPAVLQPGNTTVTYISGAWINHVPSGVYLGWSIMEVPDLNVDISLGTDEPVGFATYAEAESAAMGDQFIVENTTGGPVTAYFFVGDSCPQGGYCHDNSGEITFSLTNDTVANEGIVWSSMKALYR